MNGRITLVGARSNRQRVWEAILWTAQGNSRLHPGPADGGPVYFSLSSIAHESKVQLQTVSDYAKCLVAAGYLAQHLVSVVPTNRPSWIYTLEINTGIEAPRLRADGTEHTAGRKTEACWDAMITLDAFTHKQIAEIAGVNGRTASNYVYALARVGILYVITQARRCGNPSSRNEGVFAVPIHRRNQRAPQVTRTRSVYDPSTNQLLPLTTAEEAVESIETGGIIE